ncbi:MAG: CinA family protein [Burkholderiaceae bacterium]
MSSMDREMREPLLVATALAFAAERGTGSMEVRTAESCTGGLLASWLTCLPGSSRWYAGGVVSYANDRKQAWLGVKGDDLTRHGAVSEPVAQQMVLGLLAPDGQHASGPAADRSRFGVAITGVAGPGGGSIDKPVGTVWFAWGASGQPVLTQRCSLAGGRWQVQRQAARWAASGLFGLMIRSSAR